MSSDPVNLGAIKSFGDVRSMLHVPPNAKVWESMCHALSNWPSAHELDTLVLPYVLTHLERWPDRLRVCPERWIDGMIRGARAPMFSIVRALTLAQRGLGDVDLLTLARAPALRHITMLDLSDNPIGLYGLGHLMGSPHIEGLEVLRLDGVRPVGQGLELLATSGRLRHLTSLIWTRSTHDAVGVRALCASTQLEALSSLDLSDNGALGKEEVEALSQSPLFPRLQALTLHNIPLKMSGLTALVRRADPSSLRQLGLRATGIHDAALQMLARSANMEHLERLDLGEHICTDQGVCAMARSTHFPGLTSLDLRGGRVSQKSALGWSQATGYPHLAFLGLSVADIGEQGAALLAGSDVLGEDVRAYYARAV